jgi:DNA repair exonuclease SbcCD nuclease subunit
MRIAVTADLHLRESNPERLENLNVLIEYLLSQKIQLLIIAGDLFDTTDESYAQVDALAGNYPEIRLMIIPGNHDASLRAGMFAAKNVQVIGKPSLKRIDEQLFLFLPYREGSTIGETIATLKESEQLRRRSWILISHGDFTAPRPQDSGRERGYFPLTREDLARYKPTKVILGHIHAPNSLQDPVLYPGSPYPIAEDEFGQRRLLIVETETAVVTEQLLSYPPLHMRAEFFLIPDGFEEKQIETQLEAILQGNPENLRLQVVLRGYTTDRNRASKIVEKLLTDRKISYSGVNLESLRISDDESLATLADTVRQRVAQLGLDYQDADSLRQTVLEKALAIVYGA